MGYSTDFEGRMRLTPPLTPAQIGVISQINEQRHGGDMDVEAGKPGFWCHWCTDGMTLSWDGGEKTYKFAQWLQWLIDNHFSKWGVEVHGKMLAQGEDRNDRWTLEVGADQKVDVKRIDLQDLGITY